MRIWTVIYLFKAFTFVVECIILINLNCIKLSKKISFEIHIFNKLKINWIPFHTLDAALDGELLLYFFYVNSFGISNILSWTGLKKKDWICWHTLQCNILIPRLFNLYTCSMVDLWSYIMRKYPGSNIFFCILTTGPENRHLKILCLVLLQNLVLRQERNNYLPCLRCLLRQL